MRLNSRHPAATTRLRTSVAGIALAMCLFGAPLGYAAPAEKISVTDAGSRVTVEAHNATLNEVFERMTAQLKIKFVYTERLDLTRVIDGRTSGSLKDVMAWLVPSGGFMMLYGEDDANAARVTRISFVSTSAGGGKPGPMPSHKAMVTPASTPASTPLISQAPPTPPAVTPGPAPAPTTAAAAAAPPVAPESRDVAVSVADQLRASTMQTQTANAASAGGGSGSNEPAFMQGGNGNGGSQGSLQEQAARSQQLAVQQLQALMGAYKAACTGNPLGPC